MRTGAVVGWIKDQKVQKVSADADAAAAAGRRVFVCRMNVGKTDPGMSGEVPSWGEMVESVESSGWTLDRWSVATDSRDRPEAYLLFRR